MFFSIQLLGKNSPLGKLWLAAHAEKRLKRRDITSTSISKSVDHILTPNVPLALRLSGVLLLGVVNIYSLQIKYLHEDCEKAKLEMDKIGTNAGRQAAESKKTKLPNSAKAKASDIEIPADGSLLFYGEDEFGLFDHDSSGLAQAAEAHNSFMQINIPWSQHDDSGLGSMDLSMDEPEQLRAVSLDPIDGHALGDDPLPRMTPTKSATLEPSLDRLPSRDADADKASQLRGSVGRMSQDEEMALEPMDDLPEFPALPLPQHIQQSHVAGTGNTEGDAAEDVANQGVLATDMDGPAPVDEEMDPRSPLELDAPVPLEDEMDPPAPIHEAVDAEMDVPDVANALPDEELGQAQTPVPNGHGAAVEELQSDQADVLPQVSTPVATRKAEKAKKKAATPVKAAAKRTLPKLRRDASMEATKLPQSEMRLLLQDRSTLMRQLQPLIAPRSPGKDHPDVHSLDAMMMPAALNDAELDGRMRVLLEGIGSCKPLTQAALRGDRSAGAVCATKEDAIEDTTQSPQKRHSKAAPEVATPEPVPAIENLRQAQSQSQQSPGAAPGSVNMGGIEIEEELDKVPDIDSNAAGNNEVAGNGGLDDEILSPRDIPFEPEPLISPQFDALQAEDIPQPSVSVSGVDNHQERADAPVESAHLRSSTLEASGNEDASLNAHTLRTLGRLEDLASAPGDSRKRKMSSTVYMGQLIESQDRKEAAKLFYDVLVLQAKSFVQLQPQTEPYEELQITLVN